MLFCTREYCTGNNSTPSVKYGQYRRLYSTGLRPVCLCVTKNCQMPVEMGVRCDTLQFQGQGDTKTRPIALRCHSKIARDRISRPICCSSIFQIRSRTSTAHHTIAVLSSLLTPTVHNTKKTHRNRTEPRG